MGHKIILGVSGSIAAYKACEVTRLLRESDFEGAGGCEVRVAMTPAAESFVGAQTFEALSGAPVVRSSSENPLSVTGSKIAHTDLAAWADLLLVAPCSADLLSKLAHGLGDDAISLLHLALAPERPRLVAPAMNVEMWRSPGIQRAVRRLADSEHPRAARFIGPDAGDLACGAVGPGRMADPASIVAAVRSLLAPRDLAGRRVLILSGPTRERLDAVRYVSNGSSGRMGRALAEAARARGAAEVVVVTGPAEILPAYGIRTIAVESAEEMLTAASPEAARADLVIGAAAVADFRFRDRAKTKIARVDLPPALAIEPTPDVLGTLAGARRPGQVFVGFAAESADDGKAERERAARGLDLVLWNLVPQAIGSGSAVAAVLSEGGREELGLLPKEEIASRLLARAAAMLPAAPISAEAGRARVPVSPV